MSRKIITLIFAVAAFMIWSCTAIVEQELIDKPVVIYEGMSVTKNSLLESSPVFRFRVENSNPMNLRIRNIAYDFKINDRKFIKGIVDKGLRVKAVSSERLTLAVTFNYLDIGSVARIIGTDTITYDLSGFVRVGPFPVPYQTSGIMEIPKLPEIALTRVDISDFSFTEPSVMIFVLDLENIQEFPVHPHGLSYTIRLGGREFASGLIRPSMDARYGSTVEIPVKISFSESGWAVDDVLTKSSSDYELSGELRFYMPKIGEKRLPFRKRGEVVFHKK